MSEPTPRHEITTKPVLYQIPGMEAVSVRRDVEFSAADGGTLTMDLYYPPDRSAGARLPAVVFVAGFPGLGFERFVGCAFKDMESYITWGRLIAASGLIAVAYVNRQPEPDLDAALAHIRQHAESLGIDEQRIGIWACSGNVPLAIGALTREGQADLTCAALLYGYMLDLDGSTAVGDAARMMRFANPAEGKSVSDLPRHLPLLVARAGRDQTPRLNESLDALVAAALTQNLPLTFVNHPTGPHAFDLSDDSATTRAVVRQTLEFLRAHLLVTAQGGVVIR